MTTFGDVQFSVVTSDGSLPLPAIEESTGITYYAPEMKFTDRETMLDMAALFSVATVKPAIGLIHSGTVIIEKGHGVDVLTYPDGIEEIAVNAVLISWSPMGRSHSNNFYRVQTRFVLLDEPEP